jgi:hypothetical protein
VRNPRIKISIIFAAALGACSGVGGSTAGPVGNSSSGLACPASPATDLFENTVCVCEDLNDIGNLVVGRAIATDDAVLAVNGHSNFINNADIRGSLIAYGGLEAAGNVITKGTLASAGDVRVLGNVESRADIEVGGALKGIGHLEVDGTLRVAGTNSFLGLSEVNEVGPYGTTPAPPCGCDPSTYFDVKAAVADAKSQNDNAAQGLPTTFANIGFSELRLTSGSYYFSDSDNIGFTRIIIDGTVALYVDGNVDNIGAEVVRLTTGSTLDLYVSGDVRNIGHIVLGDKYAPSSFRLYIGGSDKATVNVGNAIFNGAIYAPEANLHYIGNTLIRGALFAKKLTGIGNLVIGYASPNPQPDDCPQPDPDSEPEPEPEPEQVPENEPDPETSDPPIIVD